MSAATTSPAAASAGVAAGPASLAGEERAFTLTVHDQLLRRLEAVIDASGLGVWFETELTDADTRPGGRRRTLRARTLLVALLALAVTDAPLILRDAARLLNALPPSVKHRLGIPRAHITGEGAVSERQVSYLYNRMVTLLDPSPHAATNRDAYEAAKADLLTSHADPVTGELDNAAFTDALAELKATHAATLAGKHARLRWVLDRGLDATLPTALDHSGSYALDASEVRSWARQNRRITRAPWLYPDPDAAWNGKKSHRQGTPGRGWYGYWLHAITRVGDIAPDGTTPDVPCLTERIELTPANADVRVAGVELLTRMVADHTAADATAGRADRPRKDVLADKAYTSETRRADDWIWPLWALGFTSVHDLTEHQLGPAKRGTPKPASGALVIDGQPYSPRLPAQLRSIAPPKLGATRADIAAYQKLYALHPVGGRNLDGSWDFGCRAMSLLGQLRCDLKPDSLDLPVTVPTTSASAYTPPNGQLPKVCGQQKARIRREELPYWQPDLYGSVEWYRSYNRRNRVEGAFGNVKNSAAQDVSRGRTRVMGLAKTSLMTMFAVMAANLRLLDTWAARQDEAAASAGQPTVAPVRRRPRRRTLLLEQARARIAAAQVTADAVAGHRDPDPPPQE